eukprot:TRINITY_DN10198_c0_g1_i5.p1 TRINITY_DN10198_c0_g1~~TRINITY_DN10198_c0_g1_i5.p1  ORF type:complete len:100 (-),score=6.58 TRINITY_DN10198_c0_g1_i5:67-366(-)
MTRSQDPDDVNDVPSQWAEIQQLLPYDVVNKEFSGRSDWEGLLQTVFHASCAAITGYAMSLTLSYSQGTAKAINTSTNKRKESVCVCVCVFQGTICIVR